MAKGVPAQTGKDKAKTKEVVAQAHDLIAEHYLDLTQALIDKAVGLRFQDEKGNVYTKEPDTTALIRAIEILGGKPVARVETSEAGGFSEYEEWIKGQVASAGAQSVPAPPPAAVKVLAPSGWKQTPLENGLERIFWDGGGLPEFDPVPPSAPPQRPSEPPPADVAGAVGVEGAGPPGKDAIADILKDIGWGP